MAVFPILQRSFALGRALSEFTEFILQVLCGIQLVKRSIEVILQLCKAAPKPFKDTCADMFHKAGISIIICELVSVRHPDGRNNVCIVAKPSANCW